MARGAARADSTGQVQRQGRGRGKGSGRAGTWKSQGRGKAGGEKRRPLADLIDYLRACCKTLDVGLSSQEEQSLLAGRAVEEAGDRLLLVASDQRGSKPLEKLLKQASSESFSSAFRQLLEALPDLATNQYASHVLEATLTSWTQRQDNEVGTGADAAGADVSALVKMCGRLEEEGLYNTLAHDACASHVLRALTLSLGGFAPQAQGKDQAAARAGLLPERRVKVSSEIVACRRALGKALAQLIREDETFCLSPHASPVVQLVLRVLHGCGDTSLCDGVASAVVAAKGKAPSIERCEALLLSASGSRALEAVLEVANSELFMGLFNRFFRPRFTGLVRGESGEFGAFVAARVVDGLRDEPQLNLAFAGMDFGAALGPSSTAAQQAVAVKFAEACLRLRAGHRQCATEIFTAFGLRAPSEHPRAWPTLLSLQRMEALSDLLDTRRPRKKADDDDGAVIDQSENTKNIASSVLKKLPVAGPQLVVALLKFPTETVQPLNGGLPKLLSHSAALAAMAHEKKTARVLEAAMAPASALQPKLRMKLAAAFKGLLGALGPHPVGGWVCAAVWRASLGHTSLRESIAQELLEVEAQLRSENFAVWKVCGLNQVKLRHDAWEQQQQRASKAKRVFDELLEGSEVQDAKAKPLVETRPDEGNEVQDPLVAGLLPVAEISGQGAAESLLQSQDQDGPAAAEIDELFQRKRGKHALSKTDQAKTQQAASGLPLSKPKEVQDDALLQETLQLIAGKAPNARKRRKKAAKAAQAAMSAEADEEMDLDS